MPIYDFQCSSGHTSERLARMETTHLFCKCGRLAERSPVNRVAQRTGGVLEMDSITTRQKFRLFQEASQELAATTTNDINLWAPAKARAEALVAAGEAPTIRKEVTHA